MKNLAMAELPMKDPKSSASVWRHHGSVGGRTLLFLTDRPEYFQRCTSAVVKHTFSHHTARDTDFVWKWIRLVVWPSAQFECAFLALCAAVDDD